MNTLFKEYIDSFPRIIRTLWQLNNTSYIELWYLFYFHSFYDPT